MGHVHVGYYLFISSIFEEWGDFMVILCGFNGDAMGFNWDIIFGWWLSSINYGCLVYWH